MLSFYITLSNRIFYPLSFKLQYVFCSPQNRAQHKLNAIGHCIAYNWFVFVIQIPFKIEDWTVVFIKIIGWKF